MSKTDTVSPLRQRMIEDMAARKLNPHTQRSHISSCKRFAAWLKRSPDTATPDEVRRFQLHLVESGASICNRNRIMTGVRFLFRVTLRRHDLAAEVWTPWHRCGCATAISPVIRKCSGREWRCLSACLPFGGGVVCCLEGMPTSFTRATVSLTTQLTPRAMASIASAP